MYKAVLRCAGRKGLPRNINGTGVVLLPSELYTLGETYEPEVWPAIMAEVREGDVIADVGAHIGLYTLAFAQRVGATGHVYAFEPDPASMSLLRRGVELNGVGTTTTALACAAGDGNEKVLFTTGRGSESHVTAGSGESGAQIETTSLDEVFDQARLDLLKIDVEGYEAHVLRGARRLLGDPDRAPPVIFIEVHPYAWERYGTTAELLLGLLTDCDYQVSDLRGNILSDIQEYGEIVARRE
jgi:FkbM family methyltransferase